MLYFGGIVNIMTLGMERFQVARITKKLIVSGSLIFGGVARTSWPVAGAVTVVPVTTAAYSIASVSCLYHVSRTSTSSVALLLLSAIAVNDNVIEIKDAGLNANTNNITISTEGSEKVDGQDTLVLSGDGDSIFLYCYDGNWFIK